MQNSRKKRTTRDTPQRTHAGSRMQVACITCKERKLKCDDQVPACANCDRHGLKCFVEDPATKRRQARNYLETLEQRVAHLEGLLQQARPDGTPSVTSMQSVDNGSSSQRQEDYEINDLASKAGMLDLKAAAGSEPHYLGSSSAFAFSRVLNSFLRQGISEKVSTGFNIHESHTTTPSPCLLPDYDTGVILSNANFQNINPHYPFLHEPTFRL
ncbi:uncharacterized protein PAC_06269 [Phialocephala subalpina]|uniref:Zn(2)-C6 fungal-type domain-containing protein n=1 Tax=Phialocephala subalpina TaxID=576137 RepID=A0A1L7WUA9_9HELO|nr:uncharacterized protein PAC_06269 [Phialocephala subalpina]